MTNNEQDEQEGRDIEWLMDELSDRVIAAQKEYFDMAAEMGISTGDMIKALMQAHVEIVASLSFYADWFNGGGIEAQCAAPAMLEEAIQQYRASKGLDPQIKEFRIYLN